MKRFIIISFRLSLFAVFIIFSSCKTLNTFTDERDGQKYKTVKIGKQTWMAENLNYVTNIGSWCYNDSVANSKKYGRLYNWETANTVCPTGWHLPDNDEWKILLDNLGGENVAGGKLKSKMGWNSPNTDATNSSGFSGLPGGYRSVLHGGEFLNRIDYGNWWLSDEASKMKKVSLNKTHAKSLTLSYNISVASISESYKGTGFSVRCLKNDKSETNHK